MPKGDFNHLRSIVGNLPAVTNLIQLYGRLLKYTLPSSLWGVGDLGGREKSGNHYTRMGAEEFAKTTAKEVLRDSPVNQNLRNYVGVLPSGGSMDRRKRRVDKLRWAFEQGLSDHGAPDAEALDAIAELASAVKGLLK